MNQPCYIVTQCYGNEGVFLECAFALLSLSRLYKPAELEHLEIWIYTDKPEWFQAFKNCNLPLHYRQIDNDIIKKWRGIIDFVHRIKIEALLDFTKNRTGNILYADTDVMFTHRIDDVWTGIQEGNLYMHMMEGKVSSRSNPIFAKLDKYLRSPGAPTIDNRPLYDMNMWNAGILGFHTSKRQLLEQALDFTDREYPKFPKHIIEQFAFSVYFQHAGAVHTALPFVLHYWDMKEVRAVFKSFLTHFNNSNWKELTRLSGMVQLYELASNRNKFLHSRSITEKLSKKQWSPPMYDWAGLLKQL